MLRRALVSLVVALSVAACADTDFVNAPALPGSRPTASPTAAVEDNRSVAIYAAVIRRLVNVDNTFGGAPTPFKRVFLMDAPDDNAQHSWEQRRRGAPFSEATRRALAAALADLPPLQFVADAAEGRSNDGVVRDSGVTITVGPIVASGDHVRVPNGLWCGGTCGQWLTYLVDRTADGWQVSGNTGEVMIS